MVDIIEASLYSSIQNPIGAELFLLRYRKAYWHASCALLYFPDPDERGSADVSASGCNEKSVQRLHVVIVHVWAT
ncbi:MAG: hypothetical protein C5S49_06635 [Candidatus Methanogaster sp.]|nr:MAG: hypothetical protein C5S49_06635 [ANME-2 cluster archaeon]